jgi:hypothetical protein
MKSATYEISGAAALRQLAENKRAAKTAAAKGKNPRVVPRTIPSGILQRYLRTGYKIKRLEAA